MKNYSNINIIDTLFEGIRRNGILVSLLLLFALTSMAQTSEKVTPVVSFSETNIDVIVSEKSFNPPVPNITANGQSVRKYFTLSFTIKGGDILKKQDGVSDSTDAADHNYIVDETTGTTINSYTGDVYIGSKAAGDVTILMTAKPSTLYENVYNEASGSYTLNIKSPGNELYNFTTDANDREIKTTKKDLEWNEKDTLHIIAKVVTKTKKIRRNGRRKTIEIKRLESTDIDFNNFKIAYSYQGLTYDVTNQYDISYNENDIPKGIEISKDKDKKNVYTIKAVIGSPDTVDFDLKFTAKLQEKYKTLSSADNLTLIVHIKSIIYSDDYRVKAYFKFKANEKEMTVYPESFNDKKYVKGTIYLDEPYKYKSYIPMIYDEFGNDISKYYNVNAKIEPLFIFNKYNKNTFDRGDKALKDLTGHTTIYNTSADLTDSFLIKRELDYDAPKKTIKAKYPNDYLITYEVEKKPEYREGDQTGTWMLPDKAVVPDTTKTTVKGQLYKFYHDNIYKIGDNQVVLHVLRKIPKIILDPEPSEVTIPENFAMGNRLWPKFKQVFYNDIIKSSVDLYVYLYNNYTLGLFIPNSIKYDKVKNPGRKGEVTIETIGFPSLENIPVDTVQIIQYGDNGEVLMNPDGTIKCTYEKGTMYILRHPDDRREEEIKDRFLKFHGTGKAKLCLIPINQDENYDLGYPQMHFINVADEDKKINVKVVIDPSSYEIRTGETAPKPSVKVIDDFKKDVTEYYDLTWTVTDNKGDKGNVIEHDPNSHLSKGLNIGTAAISVSAKMKTGIPDTLWQSQKAYAETSDTVAYQVNVRDARNYWEVIYDDSYYLHNNAGQIVYDNGIKGNESTEEKHPIPLRRNANTSKMGKLHFVNPYILNDKNEKVEAIKEKGADNGFEFDLRNSSEGEVPGMDISFGNQQDSTIWKIFISRDDQYTTDDTFDPEGNIKVMSTTCLFGDKPDLNSSSRKSNMYSKATPYPVSGGFLTLKAKTNGFLVIDGNYGTAKNKVHYYLVDKDDGTMDMVTQPRNIDATAVNKAASTYKKRLSIVTSDGTGNKAYDSTNGTVIDEPDIHVETEGEKAGRIHGDRRFRYALLEGHTYYLYNDGDNFSLHGLQFQPAFINIREDEHSTHKGTIFIKSRLNGGFAMTEKEKNDFVTFSRSWATNDWATSNNGVRADSAFTISDIGLPYGKIGIDSPRVRMRAEVKGIDRTKEGLGQVERAPYMDVAIVDIPIYQVTENDNEALDAGERVSTTNYVTGIWMTWGGFEHAGGDKNYPYYKKNDPKGNVLSDAWKPVSKIDSVGMNGKTLDGFHYFRGATQNPANENVANWNPFMIGNTFDVPVRGGYVKFEPEESGTILLYVLQNGMTDLNKYNENSIKSKPQNLRRRAFYVIDETGNPVDLSKSQRWTLENGAMETALEQKVKVNETDNVKLNPNYITQATNRCSWNDFTWTKGAVTKFEWDKGQWDNNYKGGKNDDNLKADKDNIIAAWKANDYGNTEMVIPLSDHSYVVPTKAYVRYTIDVKAGKTYYAFLTGSKLQCCGFAFIPNHFFSRGSNKQWPQIEYDDDGTPYVMVEGKRYTTEYAHRYFLPYPSDDKFYGHNAGDDGRPDHVGYDDQTIVEDDRTTEKNTIAGQPVDNAIVNFVNVEVKRPFVKNEWTGICLPFSVSEKKVKELFGTKAQLIVFDSVMTEHKEQAGLVNPTEVNVAARTAHFTYHVSQLIEAGRPYFIRPTFEKVEFDPSIGKTVTTPLTHELIPDLTFDENNDTVVTAVKFCRVSLESVKPMDIICSNKNAKSNIDLATATLPKLNEEYKLDSARIDTLNTKLESLDAEKNSDEYNSIALDIDSINDELKNDTDQIAYYNSLKTNKRIFTYRFAGIYDCQQIPWFSYIMSTKPDARTDDDNANGLWRIVPNFNDWNTDKTARPYLKGYRSYLYPYTDEDGKALQPTYGSGDNTSGAKLADYWITGADVYGDGDGSVDGIDQLVEAMNTMMTTGHKGVYNLKGQLMRTENNLNGLPAGVYIMNGQKYLIK